MRVTFFRFNLPAIFDFTPVLGGNFCAFEGVFKTSRSIEDRSRNSKNPRLPPIGYARENNSNFLALRISPASGNELEFLTIRFSLTRPIAIFAGNGDVLGEEHREIEHQQRERLFGADDGFPEDTSHGGSCLQEFGSLPGQRLRNEML